MTSQKLVSAIVVGGVGSVLMLTVAAGNVSAEAPAVQTLEYRTESSEQATVQPASHRRYGGVYGRRYFYRPRFSFSIGFGRGYRYYYYRPRYYGYSYYGPRYYGYPGSSFYAPGYYGYSYYSPRPYYYSYRPRYYGFYRPDYGFSLGYRSGPSYYGGYGYGSSFHCD